MGTTVYHFYQCRTVKTETAYRGNPQFRPDRLSNIRLKNRLCAAGPDYCAKCRSCGYGLEWLRRHPEGGGEK